MKTKKVQVLTIIALMLILCCALSACDPNSYSFTKEDLDDVVSIELINYDNPKQKHFKFWSSNHSSQLKSFDYAKMECMETLDESKIADFADTLQECHILYKYYTSDSLNGPYIKVNYINGDFLIVGSDYIGKFSFDGKVENFIGCFEGLWYYQNLLNMYFQTEINVFEMYA